MDSVASALRLNMFGILSRLIIVFASGILVEVATTATRSTSEGRGCVLDVQKDLTLLSPILLNNKMQILFPSSVTGKISLSVSQQVWFACSGGSNYFVKPSHPKDVTAIVGRCVSGTIFDVGENMDITNITCQRLPESILRKTNSSCNGKNNTLAEIGFLVNTTTFINQIQICFDEQRCKPIYTKHELPPTVKIRQTLKSFTFRNVETNLFSNLGERPGNLYPCTKQKEILAEILGSAEQVVEYNQCPTSTSTQLVKGHLTPNADFTFSFQQNASYYHANTAPQWMFFNNRNWKSLEERIRSQAYIKNHTFQIHTGTSEQSTYMPDVNGNNVNISLSPKNNMLPAPLYYWKLVYDTETQEGIGFIGYNVHYDQDPPFFSAPNYTSICEKYSWFKDSEITMEKGLVYCMPVLDLLNITGLNDFTDNVSDVIEYGVSVSTRHLQEEPSKSASGELWSLGFKIVFVTILALY